MTNEELIAKIKDFANEQKELLNGFELQSDFRRGETAAYSAIISFLDTLESERPMNPDDAMKELDEKIALVKERGTWDGVDVDKYMDEVRGREPEKPMNLEEEINRYLHEECSDDDEPGIHEIAEHFAEWGYLRAAEKYNEMEYNRQREEESVPNDLEEAKEAYCEEHNDDCFDATGDKCPHIRNAFIAGAKWQKKQYHFFNKAWAENMQAELDRNYENGKQAMKEQMMEEAVAVEVVGDKRDLRLIDSTQRCLFNAKRGDWLKIIIVKED